MKFIVFAVCLLSTPALATSTAEFGFRAKARAHVRTEVAEGRAADLIVRGLDAMIERAAEELEANGLSADAEQLAGEWAGSYRSTFLFPSDGVLGDMGDHEAELVSKWLNDWYLKLEDQLGVTIMEATHLRDIWVFNNGFKITFSPHAETNWCAETLKRNPGDFCGKEYERNVAGTRWVPGIDPFPRPVKHHGTLSVASYWVAWAACEGFLWGSDGSFLCGPASNGVEFLVERYVAVPASQRIWTHYNP